MLISPRAPSGRGASCVLRDQGLWLAHARRPLATFFVPLAGHMRIVTHLTYIELTLNYRANSSRRPPMFTFLD